MKTTQFLAAGFATCALSFVSCTPSQQQYGLGGAAAGGVIGAIAGGDSKDITRAAAVGALAGAGYATYQDNQRNKTGVYNQGGDIYQPQAPASNYASASRTSSPGIVISPYKPYNKVNVSGFKPGQLAKDPTTGQIFVVPN